MRILKFQQFAVSSIFSVRILDFACEEVWIADLNECQKCVVSEYVYFLSRTRLCMSRIREIVTHWDVDSHELENGAELKKAKN